MSASSRSGGGEYALEDALRQDTQAMASELVELRHRLHRRPKLGLDLPMTQRMVLDGVDGLGLEIHLGESLSSVTAVLRGGAPVASGMVRTAIHAAAGDPTVSSAFCAHPDGPGR